MDKTSAADELREYCKDLYKGGPNYMTLMAIADRIDAEMVELPKDRDGIPIHAWDTVYDRKSGSQMKVRSLSFNGQWHLTTNKGHISNTSLVACEMPDSLERIADDIEKTKGTVFISEKTLDGWAGRIRKLATKEDK